MTNRMSTWAWIALHLGLPLALGAGALGLSYALFGVGGGWAWTLTELTEFSLWYGYLVLAVALTIGVASVAATRPLRRRLKALHREHTTGFLNRAGFAGLVRRVLRRNDPVSLVLLELTGLEQLREEQGRAALHDAYRQVAEGIDATRLGRGVRFDGFTFGVLLPQAEPEAARAAAEHLSDALCATLRRIHPALSVRVGVGTAGAATETPVQLYRQAEARLEAARESLSDLAPVLSPEFEPAERVARVA